MIIYVPFSAQLQLHDCKQPALPGNLSRYNFYILSKLFLISSIGLRQQWTWLPLKNMISCCRCLGSRMDLHGTWILHHRAKLLKIMIVAVVGISMVQSLSQPIYVDSLAFFASFDSSCAFLCNTWWFTWCILYFECKTILLYQIDRVFLSCNSLLQSLDICKLSTVRVIPFFLIPLQSCDRPVKGIRYRC